MARRNTGTTGTSARDARAAQAASVASAWLGESVIRPAGQAPAKGKETIVMGGFGFAAPPVAPKPKKTAASIKSKDSGGSRGSSSSRVPLVSSGGWRNVLPRSSAPAPAPRSVSEHSHSPIHSPVSAMTTISTVSSEASDFADMFSANRRPAVREVVPPSPSLASPTAYLPPTVHPKRASDNMMGPPSSPQPPPLVDEVLPFVSSPFAAWDPAAAGEVPGAATKKLYGRNSKSVGGSEWHEDPPKRGSAGSKRTWIDSDGREIRTVYRVGWERDVLDLESRLHETMWNVTGGHHTFVDVEDRPPATVLDIGTGIGLWPIAQALAWPKTRFIATDIVPCHTDLNALVAAEERARTTSAGVAPGEGIWSSVAKRIEFQQYNFLNGLPYDSGVFDMVHMRFLGLGVPEQRWAELLDEAVRVLRPGGVLEIVEMSCEPPPSASEMVRSRFANLLLEDYIPPNPVLALQMHLPATAGLVASTTRPVLSASWDAEGAGVSPDDMAPDAIADAPMVWISSALGYKGTPRDSKGGRVAAALAKFMPGRWHLDFEHSLQSHNAHLQNQQLASPPDTPGTPSTPGMPVTPGADGAFRQSSGKIVLAAWVVFKTARGRTGSAPQQGGVGGGGGIGLGMGLAS